MPNNAQILLAKITFPVFLLSVTFMVTSSNNAINYWEGLWGQLSITIACLLPLSLIILSNASRGLLKKDIPLEIYFISLIIILGILNVVFGEQLLSNLKGMGLFLLSGISIFGTTLFILKSRKAQTIFLWFCSFTLLAITANCIYFYKIKLNSDEVLFSGNPIPESITITLLLVGPLILRHHYKKGLKNLFLNSCLLLGMGAIIILEQRTAILALLIIIYITGYLYIKNWGIYSLCAIAILSISLKLGYNYNDQIRNNIQVIIEKFESPPIYRLEMYFFALHLIKKEPLFGVGLWAPLTHHVTDYKEQVFITPEHNKTEFVNFVNFGENTSFHSLPLCMLVQMGTLFTIVYLGLILYLFSNIFITNKISPESKLLPKLLLIPIIGFFVQSMAVDSLMYPANNFLFHSFLGLYANLTFDASKSPSVMQKNEFNTTINLALHTEPWPLS